MRVHPLLLGLLVAAPSLTSCSVLDLEIGHALDVEVCRSFESGSTHRAEVLAALGPPTGLAAHADGVALLYEHLELSERQLGFSLEKFGVFVGAPWLAFLKVSLGGSGAAREATLFVFDAEGILAGKGRANWTEEFGRGGTVQFIVVVEEVVESGTLRGPPRAILWGLEFLDPLPRTLNSEHSAPLELRGTPTKAGQGSLGLLGDAPKLE